VARKNGVEPSAGCRRGGVWRKNGWDFLWKNM
jgi:hypothetical protein